MRKNLGFWIVLTLAAMLLFSGCGIFSGLFGSDTSNLGGGNGTIHVLNATASSVSIDIDGSYVGSISAGTSANYTVASGSHIVSWGSGQQSVFVNSGGVSNVTVT